MPKIIQMPKLSAPAEHEKEMRRSLIVPDEIEESGSMARINRWLELADFALKKAPSHERVPA